MNEPTAKYVRNRLKESDGQDNYYRADPALATVFDACRGNRNDGCVIAKVAVLNALYATRIFDIYPVVNHILELDIDDRLRRGDLDLVGDVARVKFKKKVRTLLSFASKYCAWHEPELFQIFDSRVETMLWRYGRRFAFAKFRRWELRDFPTFTRLIGEFRTFFDLKDFTRKQIDKFLWMEGG